MPSQPSLVSVIVPVYNAHKTLHMCLQSILSQSHDVLEVLLVDDGSRDQSLSILREYAKADPRVHVFSKANGGVSSARNLALEHATGEYVQFVDSDDMLLPHATARLLKAIQSQGCDMAIGRYIERFNDTRQERGYLKTDMVLSQQSLLGRLSLHPNSFYYAVLWNKLYRRDLIAQHGIRFLGGLPWGEDFAFNTQYMRYVDSAAMLSGPVYEYNRNFNGLALTTARRTVAHPIYAIRVKLALHHYYKQLYIDTGLYARYRRVLPRYLFKVTINQ